MNKRGVLGLDTAVSFVLAILVLAILVFSGIIVFASLNDNSLGNVAQVQTEVVNETLTTVAETGEDFAAATVQINPVCTIRGVVNATDGAVIGASNYTQTNCNLAASATSAFNNTNWRVTYYYTWDKPEARDVNRNVSAGYTSLMANSGTWFSLLAIVIIILIITVVIITVKRLEGSGSGMSGGGSGEAAL